MTSCRKYRKVRHAVRAFTLVEIAICLGIIGFALVAIIGILPAGLQVQRDNKEDTIINQEGQFLLEAIRNGAKELWDLTNRTEEIVIEHIDGSGNPPVLTQFKSPHEVIGLLSTPSDVPTGTDIVRRDATYLVADAYDTNKTRQVRAIIRAGAGAAGEWESDLAFRYEVTIRNFELATANPDLPQDLRDALASQLREVRMDFRWPVLPNGKVGNGRHVFRAAIQGRLEPYWPDTPTNRLAVPIFFFQEGR
jgi:type II secretory pathway pseudopilin PulG